MGSPITWRNVDAPDLRGAAGMLQLANTGINSGFDKLNQVLQNEQATTDANWKVQRDNNTQAFLNSINQYRTPEEYQAALASGALNAGQYGAQIDQAAVRSALDGRLSVLQDRTVKANQHADMIKAREAAPIVDKLSTMALSEDKAVRQSAKEALGIYADNGMVPRAAEIAGNIRNTEHQNVVWDQESQTFKDTLATNASRRGLMGAQTTAAIASANSSNASADRDRAASSSATAALKAELAATKAAAGAAELKIKNSPLDAGTMDTYAGQKAFEAELEKLGLPAAQANSVRQQYTKQFGNGVLVGYDDSGKEVRIGLPVSTALAGVRGTEDDWIRANWAGNSFRGENAVKRVKEMLGEKSYVDSLQEAMQAQGIQYRPLQLAAEKSAGAPAPTRRSILPKPTPEEDYSGGALVQQAVQARADKKSKAESMMTQAEIDLARKTGQIPFRVKRLLESDNRY